MKTGQVRPAGYNDTIPVPLSSNSGYVYNYTPPLPPSSHQDQDPGSVCFYLLCFSAGIPCFFRGFCLVGMDSSTFIADADAPRLPVRHQMIHCACCLVSFRFSSPLDTCVFSIIVSFRSCFHLYSCVSVIVGIATVIAIAIAISFLYPSSLHLSFSSFHFSISSSRRVVFWE